MRISDALLYDLLSVLKLKQIPLAIEVLRERITAKDLTAAHAACMYQSAIHSRVPDEFCGLDRGDHEEWGYQ